jgi:hypothetical protein
MFEALVGEKAPSTISSDGEARSALSNHVDREYAAGVLTDLRRRVPLLS